MPSACGQSDPNRIRSTGMCRASSGTASSTNGATQQFSWNWSTGFFENNPGVLAVQHLQPVEQIADPRAAVLDVGDPHARVALEEAVGDEDAGEVVHQAVLHEHGDDGRVPVDGVAGARGLRERPHSSATAA